MPVINVNYAQTIQKSESGRYIDFLNKRGLRYNKKVWELIKSSVPKNTTFGGAMISDKHSNFFVNKNNATFNDMKQLINFVKKNVKKKTGINLDLEIEIVG